MNQQADHINKRYKKIKILLIENATIFISTMIFAKLVVFNHYRRFNLPIKFLLTLGYTSLIEPLTIYTGFFAHYYLSSDKGYYFYSYKKGTYD